MLFCNTQKFANINIVSNDKNNENDYISNNLLLQVIGLIPNKQLTNDELKDIVDRTSLLLCNIENINIECENNTYKYTFYITHNKHYKMFRTPSGEYTQNHFFSFAQSKISKILAKYSMEIFPPKCTSIFQDYIIGVKKYVPFELKLETNTDNTLYYSDNVSPCFITSIEYYFIDNSGKIYKSNQFARLLSIIGNLQDKYNIFSYFIQLAFNESTADFSCDSTNTMIMRDFLKIRGINNPIIKRFTVYDKYTNTVCCKYYIYVDTLHLPKITNCDIINVKQENSLIKNIVSEITQYASVLSSTNNIQDILRKWHLVLKTEPSFLSLANEHKLLINIEKEQLVAKKIKAIKFFNVPGNIMYWIEGLLASNECGIGNIFYNEIFDKVKNSIHTLYDNQILDISSKDEKNSITIYIKNTSGSDLTDKVRFKMPPIQLQSSQLEITPVYIHTAVAPDSYIREINDETIYYKNNVIYYLKYIPKGIINRIDFAKLAIECSITVLRHNGLCYSIELSNNILSLQKIIDIIKNNTYSSYNLYDYINYMLREGRLVFSYYPNRIFSKTKLDFVISFDKLYNFHEINNINSIKNKCIFTMSLRNKEFVKKIFELLMPNIVHSLCKVGIEGEYKLGIDIRSKISYLKLSNFYCQEKKVSLYTNLNKEVGLISTIYSTMSNKTLQSALISIDEISMPGKNIKKYLIGENYVDIPNEVISYNPQDLGNILFVYKLYFDITHYEIMKIFGINNSCGIWFAVSNNYVICSIFYLFNISIFKQIKLYLGIGYSIILNKNILLNYISKFVDQVNQLITDIKNFNILNILNIITNFIISNVCSKLINNIEFDYGMLNSIAMATSGENE